MMIVCDTRLDTICTGDTLYLTNQGAILGLALPDMRPGLLASLCNLNQVAFDKFVKDGGGMRSPPVFWSYVP